MTSPVLMLANVYKDSSVHTVCPPCRGGEGWTRHVRIATTPCPIPRRMVCVAIEQMSMPWSLAYLKSKLITLAIAGYPYIRHLSWGFTGNWRWDDSIHSNIKWVMSWPSCIVYISTLHIAWCPVRLLWEEVGNMFIRSSDSIIWNWRRYVPSSWCIERVRHLW